VQDVPLLVEFLEKFGLFVHVKLPGQTKSKSVLLYHEAPRASYSDYSTLDGEDLSDIDCWKKHPRRVFGEVTRYPGGVPG
jgi:hypothetical protein